MLSRLLWLNPEADVLRALLRPQKSRLLFSKFLDDYDKRSKVRTGRAQATLALKLLVMLY